MNRAALPEVRRAALRSASIVWAIIYIAIIIAIVSPVSGCASTTISPGADGPLLAVIGKVGIEPRPRWRYRPDACNTCSCVGDLCMCTLVYCPSSNLLLVTELPPCAPEMSEACMEVER